MATVLVAAPVAHAYEIADFRGAVYRDGVQDETNYADEAGEHPDTGIVEFAFTTNGSGAPSGVTKELRVDIPTAWRRAPTRSSPPGRTTPSRARRARASGACRSRRRSCPTGSAAACTSARRSRATATGSSSSPRAAA